MRCGEGNVTIIPTVVWTVGAAALAHRLNAAMFKRFIFRRVPLWEILLQHMIYIWMLIYSLHFWAGVVQVLKYLVELSYETDGVVPVEELNSCHMTQQLLVWLSSAAPLVLHLCTRPPPRPPVLMVWVTQNPLYRQELGPFEYYLSRPLSLPPAHHHRPLRRAHSEASDLKAQLQRKRRASKSI